MRTLIPFAGLILVAALFACGSDKSADAKNGASGSDSTMVGQQPVIPVEPVDSSLMSLSPKEFLKVITANPNMPILDLRTSEAFKSGHINRAINIPANDTLLINRIAALSRIHDLCHLLRQRVIELGHRSTYERHELSPGVPFERWYLDVG